MEREEEETIKLGRFMIEFHLRIMSSPHSQLEEETRKLGRFMVGFHL